MITFDMVDVGTQLKVNEKLTNQYDCIEVNDVVTVKRDPSPPHNLCGLVITCRHGSFHSIESFLKIESDENGFTHCIVYGFDKINN